MGKVNDVEQLWDVFDISLVLGVEAQTVQRWCRSGKLPCVKMGNQWRMTKDELEGVWQRERLRNTVPGLGDQQTTDQE